MKKNDLTHDKSINLSLDIYEQEEKGMMVNKGMYIGLCLFLGGLGIHKFYSGKWFTGLLYATFCWTWIPVVLALFDLLGAMFKRPNEYGQIRV